MADVQFDEEQSYAQSSQSLEKPFLIRLVLSTGIVSTDQQAGYVLLAVAALFTILAFIFPSLLQPSAKPLTPEQQLPASDPRLLLPRNHRTL